MNRHKPTESPLRAVSRASGVNSITPAPNAPQIAAQRVSGVCAPPPESAQPSMHGNYFQPKAHFSCLPHNKYNAREHEFRGNAPFSGPSYNKFIARTRIRVAPISHRFSKSRVIKPKRRKEPPSDHARRFPREGDALRQWLPSDRPWHAFGARIYGKKT